MLTKATRDHRPISALGAVFEFQKGATTGLPPLPVLGKGNFTADDISNICSEVEEAAMNHFHIRWSDSKLDWEAFRTQHEAETSARQLVRPYENYTIEQFDGDCPRCGKGIKTRNTVV
jgi:hypothetical protein